MAELENAMGAMALEGPRLREMTLFSSTFEVKVDPIGLPRALVLDRARFSAFLAAKGVGLADDVDPGGLAAPLREPHGLAGEFADAGAAVAAALAAGVPPAALRAAVLGAPARGGPAPPEPRLSYRNFLSRAAAAAGDVTLDHEELTHLLRPQFPFVTVRSNYGIRSQPGFEGLDPPKAKKPKQPKAPKNGKEAKPRKPRKLQGNGLFFNSAVELLFMVQGNQETPAALTAALAAREKPKLFYKIKVFPPTGVVQISGTICIGGEDGVFVGEKVAGFIRGQLQTGVGVRSSAQIMNNFKTTARGVGPGQSLDQAALADVLDEMAARSAAEAAAREKARAQGREVAPPEGPSVGEIERPQRTSALACVLIHADGARGPRINFYKTGKINFLGGAIGPARAQAAFDWVDRLFRAHEDAVVYTEIAPDSDSGPDE